MKKAGIINLAFVLLLLLALSACGAVGPNIGAETRIEVDNLSDLFRALDDPELKNIALKPGIYNFSSWLQDEYGKESFDTSRSPMMHEHPEAETISGKVYLLYDSEFVFYRLNNLHIESADPDNPAQIVIEDAYSTVLALNQCSDITLSNIVFGHAVEPGHCSGDVIYVTDSDNITMAGCDIYGCGAYGASLTGSNNVSFNECVIHDCTYGCVFSRDSSASFYSSRFADCGIYDMFSAHGSYMNFYNCGFSNLQGNMINIGVLSYLSFVDCDFDQEALTSIENNPAYGSEIIVTD